MQSVVESRQSQARSSTRRFTRFVLRWPIKFAVLALVFAWRRKPIVAVVLATAFVVYWLAGGNGLPWLSSAGLSTSDSRVEQFSKSVPSSAPPPAAEQYLRGQSAYDAKTMWAALSDQMKQSQTARSGAISLPRLEQQLADTKKNGLHYDQASYVGGYHLPDGRGFYLYVVAVKDSQETRFVPFTFTLDGEGKILSID